MAIDLLVFITWTTWNRDRLIEESVAEHLMHLLPLLAAKGHADLLELAIVPNHVHVIVQVGAKPDLPFLVQALKGASARLVNQSFGGCIAIKWAAGYDARSVGRRQLGDLRRYLDSQGEHHKLKLLARWSRAEERADNAVSPR